MRKFLTSILIVLLLFNFIFCNFSTAQGPTVPVDEETGEKEQSRLEESYTTKGDDDVTNGKQAVEMSEGDGTSVGKVITGIIGVVLGILARIVNFFVLQFDVLMSYLAFPSGDAPEDEMFWFSIDKTVFNRVALFNINYFNTDDTYTVGEKEIPADGNNLKIKESITKNYYICRILALAIGLVVLIYIGIRMALSTVASDQAKYKKMLMSWVESIVILFCMPYIMSALFVFGEAITNVFYKIELDLLGNTVPGSTGTYGVFEAAIRPRVISMMFSFSGLNLAMWSIVYWFLLFTEIKFLWLYLKRLLVVGFLIMISPIITITYSIDKVGDGKAQAFSIWLKEFILNVLIQPLHALLYLIFVFSANAIAQSAPLVAVALLMAMGQAERMVKVVFDMKGSVTLRGVNKFMKKEG